MADSPVEKRIRTLSGGPKRKRPTREMDAQMRAFKKADRKPRVEGDAKIIADKCKDIKKLEEKIRLLDIMKSQRNQPYHDAQSRVARAEQELTAAREQLGRVTTAGMADVSDLTDQQNLIHESIGRIKYDIEAIIEKNSIDPIDES